MTDQVNGEHANVPIRVNNRFRIIAHRGASAYAPENTMAAFLKAEKMAVREVELDVQFSKDRHLVICHDRVLDRYGHSGRILAEMTLHELQTLDMGTWFSPEFCNERMMTLSKLFSQFGSRFTYHVEIKEPASGIERAVLCAIEDAGLERSVIISSFHEQSLAIVKDLSPSTPVAWLVRTNGLTKENISLAVALGCQHICPRASEITAEHVAEAHQILSEVRAFGVKTRDDARRVVETHCDGLTIDNPDWLKHEGDG